MQHGCGRSAASNAVYTPLTLNQLWPLKDLSTYALSTARHACGDNVQERQLSMQALTTVYTCYCADGWFGAFLGCAMGAVGGRGGCYALEPVDTA
jgi:hypothetical protein